MWVRDNSIIMKAALITRQTGLSLIELMIAIALGVVLSFAAVNLFLQAKLSYLEDEEYARLQENGRYTLRLLSRELAMAGYVGGVVDATTISTALSGGGCFDYLLDPSVPFEHHNNVTANGVGQVPNDPVIDANCLTTGEHQENTDMLVVRRSADRAHALEGVLQTWQPGLAITATDIYIRKQDYIESLTLVAGTDVDYSGQQVDVWQYEPKLLFIRNWSRVSGDGVPALCRKSLPSLTTECLVEGVENMQVEFGIENAAGNLAFEEGPSSVDITSAVVARVYLLVRSINPIAGFTNDRTYIMGRTNVPAANDGFYRRVFETTVLLRNSEVLKY
jgi:type IV pilus assembly protein PilW